MMQSTLTLSVVIVTYNRNQVLVDTISYLLAQTPACAGFRELLVIDQTQQHDAATEEALQDWSEAGAIRWLRLSQPDLVGAMNRGLLEAKGDVVLYTDDDIIPGPELLSRHLRAHDEHPTVTAVVGQVLQPGQQPQDLAYEPQGSALRRFMDFPFNSTRGRFVENVIGCNFSLQRQRALAIGGFDENFAPPVASRFESEFAKRVVAAGGSIWFEPSASIDHLAARSGGTRAQGSFLASASPIYGIGDVYFVLLVGRGVERVLHVLIRPFRQVRTRFHLRHPWWILPKFIGELRAIRIALKLKARGQRLLPRHLRSAGE